MASKLEQQIGTSEPEKENSNIKKKNDAEIGNKNNIIDIIDQKPKSFKKKKSAKIVFWVIKNL